MILCCSDIWSDIHFAVEFRQHYLEKDTMRRFTIALAFTLAWPLAALAGEADVVAVEITRQDARRFSFSVAVRHADSGWDHYADGWRVLDMDGNELGIRVLVHPHEAEQPFTRSLGSVQLPQGTTQVQIQARCLVDGWSKHTETVALR